MQWKPLNVFIFSHNIKYGLSSPIESKVTSWVEGHVRCDDFLRDVTEIILPLFDLFMVDRKRVVYRQLDQVGSFHWASLWQEWSTQGLLHFMLSFRKILFYWGVVGDVAGLRLICSFPNIASAQLHRHGLHNWLRCYLATLGRLQSSHSLWNFYVETMFSFWCLRVLLCPQDLLIGHLLIVIVCSHISSSF